MPKVQARGLAAMPGVTLNRAGPMVGVILSERGDSTIRWRVSVYASTDDGRVLVGRVLTIGPAAAAGAGAPSTGAGAAGRLIAIAACPGARSWEASAIAMLADGMTPANAEARLTLTRGGEAEYPVPSGQTPGVWPVNAEGTGRRVARLRTQQFAAGGAAQLVAPDEPFRVSITIRNGAAAGGADLFLGDVGVTAATGFVLGPGESIRWEHNRQVWAITGGAAVPLSSVVEEG